MKLRIGSLKKKINKIDKPLTKLMKDKEDPS